MRVYISGLLSKGGTLPEAEVAANRLLFAEAEGVLLKVGCEPHNPAADSPIEGWTWSDYLRRDLPCLCHCDAILKLPRWKESPGATLEHDVAVAIGLLMLTYEDGKISEWVEDA